MHGFSLNVSADVSPFERINPCGLQHCPITSLSLERGRELLLKDVKDLVVNRFEHLLQQQLPLN